MEILVFIGAKIVEYLVLPIGRQPGYVINYNSNLRTLKRQMEKLLDIKSGVQRSIDEAARRGEVIGADVERWLTAVNGMNEEVETFFKDEVKENESCSLTGWCPDLRSHYSLSRKAKKKALVVIQLQKEGSFQRISYPAPSSGIESLATGRFVDFESRKSMMEDIIAALKDDSFNAIGICGLGGIGKTITAKVVGARAKREELFDEVVMAAVTRTPDLKTMQLEIADMLGVKFHERSLPGRARRLRGRLMNCKSVLVILDDVWERLDLEAVGIPFGGEHKGCKVLLTSRSQDVCNEMGSHNFTIKLLSEVEAWDLFKEMASNCINSPDLHPVAKKVLNECGHLPIVIVAVGSALRNKNQHVWNDVLRQLRLASPENISGTVAKVYQSLELSYNFLESQEERSCLLLCCIFNENANIWVKDLVGYMKRLGLLKGIDAGAEARDRVHTLVDKLKSCYLLLDGEEQECVRMHDVIRDVIRLMVIGKQYTSTSLISYSAPPSEIEYISTEGFVDFESRHSLIEEIMAALWNDNINTIGIFGLGGVGKTTMMKQICKRAKVEKLFDEIVMATVSQTPDLDEIQDEIADNLGLKFNEQSLPERANMLQERLISFKTVLVTLDNVWARLDLEAVGIPLGDNHNSQGLCFR